jgi:hypothetical protein
VEMLVAHRVHENTWEPLANLVGARTFWLRRELSKRRRQRALLLSIDDDSDSLASCFAGLP